MTTRWVFTDPSTAETWTMPINPDSMTSPHPTKTIETAHGSRIWENRMRSVMAPAAPVTWEWEGVIRTKAHYDKLLEWANRGGILHITDHLGRTWEVIIQAFQPVDRKPTPQTPWRLRYTMKSLLLRRVS